MKPGGGSSQPSNVRTATLRLIDDVVRRRGLLPERSLTGRRARSIVAALIDSKPSRTSLAN
jgi:hypothetical protein